MLLLAYRLQQVPDANRFFKGGESEAGSPLSWQSGNRPHERSHANAWVSRYSIDKSLGGANVDASVWKPLNGPVRDWPLAVCDYRSCSSKAIVDVDQVYADSVGEGCNIYFNNDHRWYFASDQGPGEVWLMKQLDSDPTAADCECTSCVWLTGF